MSNMTFDHAATLCIIAATTALGCNTNPPMPKWAVSSPAALCRDQALGPDDFCMPAARIERWLQRADFEVTHAAISDSGSTAPYKLRLELPDGTAISAKFKQAPEGFDAFNNSPRRELAAYEIQKLFLDPDEYVVPPTVLTCLSLAKTQPVMPDLQAQDKDDCALGVLAYWIENISDDEVIAPDDWKRDPAYRDSLGNLNALTVVIGHQDNIGANFYRSQDPARPRLFGVDNGLAFSAMGANPIQLFSSQWSSVRIGALPTKALARLRKVDHAALERFRVLTQFERRDDSVVFVPHTKALDGTEGVRTKDDVTQLGLTASELTDVHLRLVTMLGEVDAGDVEEGPSEK